MGSKLQATRKQEIASSFLATRRGRGQPLDSQTRGFMESRFGHDFSRVRVHADREAAQSAERLGASAYTAGSDVVFGAGAFDRKRLAHELTHVVQQRGGGASSAALTEADARTNANRVEAGLPGQVQTGAAPGAVQCDENDDKKKKKPEEKLENEFSTTGSGTANKEGVKNKYAFSGEGSIPLFRGLKLGPVLFVDKLTLKGEGEKELDFATAKRLPGPGDITDMQAQAAVELVKWELPKLEGRGFSLGAGFEGSAALKHSMEKGVEGSAEAKGTLDAAYKSPSFLPPGAGKLTLGGSLKGTGTAGVDLRNITTAKATGKFTAGADYKSPTLRGPAGTLFGILGDKANLSIGAEGTLTGTAQTDNDPATKKKDPNIKAGVGGTLSLTGAGPQHPFAKIKFGGEGILTPHGIDSASKARVIEFSIGANF